MPSPRPRRASRGCGWGRQPPPVSPGTRPRLLYTAAALRPAGQPLRLGHYRARALLVLGDDITTDHISPAGQIPAHGEAARYLIERGEDPRDLNVFASRRGNWEVMLRGVFTNPRCAIWLDPSLPPGTARHAGTALPLWEAASRYRREGTSLVIVAGERYGTGSSRDWAAKGVALLGVRAVLASSFERIHRSNLVGMGVLPLRLPANWHPTRSASAPRIGSRSTPPPPRCGRAAACRSRSTPRRRQRRMLRSRRRCRNGARDRDAAGRRNSAGDPGQGVRKGRY